jgi:hypothetical protein
MRTERERESLLGAILRNWTSKASSLLRPYAVGEGSCRHKTSRCKPRKGWSGLCEAQCRC